MKEPSNKKTMVDSAILVGSRMLPRLAHFGALEALIRNVAQLEGMASACANSNIIATSLMARGD
jgi:hypothetical protein